MLSNTLLVKLHCCACDVRDSMLLQELCTEGLWLRHWSWNSPDVLESER